jgi:regulator of protease activity HflC (stomatin/prohibitin superfamily)
MKADYITFRQAARVSLGGMTLQIGLASALLIYGILGRDQTALSGAIFAGIGILGWLVLAIVFDQHRRERVEAMEADALAISPTAGTSVFVGQADEFRPAAKRLAGLHRYFVPSASVVIGVLLVMAGIVRFLDGQTRLAPDEFARPFRAGWGLGIGLAAAFLGFVFARYVAGLAKQAAWANLRAGAAFAVGTALIGLAIGIGNLIHLLKGPDAVLRYLQIAVPAFVFVIGIETFLNFLLGLYRPRRPGEVPRPAFDSRLLSFVAAPDRIAQSISEAINYQLGFNVTSGWFYKLLSRALVPLLALGLLIVWGLSCVVVVQPHQRGMILRFGAVVRDDVGPGWHFKMPWPVDSLYIPEYITRDRGRAVVADLTVTGLRSIDLGTPTPATKEPILWTNDHAGEEVYQFVRTGSTFASGAADGSDADLTDISMVSVEMPLRYAVSNVKLFDGLGPPHQRDEILRAAARREVVRFFQTVTLDDVLGGNRVELSGRLRDRIQAAFARLNPDADGNPRGAGVDIVFLSIDGVHPPKDTADAFEKPVQADQKLQARIEAARAEEIMVLTEVVGDPALARTIVGEINELDRLRESKVAATAVKEQEFKVQKLLENAGGSAAATLARARADRWTHHMDVRGRAARHAGRLAMYQAAPAIFRYGAYYEALRDSAKNSRVFIVPERNFFLDFDNKEKDFGQDIFKNFTTGENPDPH